MSKRKISRRAAVAAPLVIVAASGFAACSSPKHTFNGSRRYDVVDGADPDGSAPRCIAIGSAPVNQPPPTTCQVPVGKVAVTTVPQ